MNWGATWAVQMEIELGAWDQQKKDKTAEMWREKGVLTGDSFVRRVAEVLGTNQCQSFNWRFYQVEWSTSNITLKVKSITDLCNKLLYYFKVNKSVHNTVCI